MTIELWFLLVAFYAFWAGVVAEYMSKDESWYISVITGMAWPLIAIGLLTKMAWRDEF